MYAFYLDFMLIFFAYLSSFLLLHKYNNKNCLSSEIILIILTGNNVFLVKKGDFYLLILLSTILELNRISINSLQ